MAEHHRALIYVMMLGLPALFLARIALRGVVEERELGIWRNAWIFSTISFFLTGNVLIYAVSICALSVYIHRVSTAPTYLYLVLLLTAPAVGVNIGIPGVFGSIIELSPGRLLSLAFLLPAATTIIRSKREPSFSATDRLVAGFLCLLIVLSMRHGSATYVMRVCAVVLIDIALPYVVFSRSLRSAESIRVGVAALTFAALPFALAGMFEFARGWRLYDAAIKEWDVFLIQSYLFRDGMLRAAASTMEPISFGFVCMVACGCLLAVRDRVSTRWAFSGAALALIGGLVAGLSRGPWLGMAVLIIVLAAMRRQGALTLAKASSIAALLCVPLLLSSLGDRIVRLLPFVGTVETSNEDYRARLIEAAMAIIGRNPLFGSAQFRGEPEIVAMMQGQGIVDIVNTYAAIGLEFGLVGLAIFIAIFASVAPGLIRMCFSATVEGNSLAQAILATLVAILLTIGTVSSVTVIPYIYWAFLGMCMALLRIRATTPLATAPIPLSELKILGQPPMFDHFEHRDR